MNRTNEQWPDVLSLVLVGGGIFEQLLQDSIGAIAHDFDEMRLRLGFDGRRELDNGPDRRSAVAAGRAEMT